MTVSIYDYSTITNIEGKKTTVTINTELGKFSGSTVCRENDKYNLDVGTLIALYKAFVSYLKSKERTVKAQLKVLNEAKFRTEQLNNFKYRFEAGIRPVIASCEEELKTIKKFKGYFMDDLKDLCENGTNARVYIEKFSPF